MPTVRNAVDQVGGVMDRLTLSPTEVTRLEHLWQYHRRDCHHNGDVVIEYRSGGGIGTVTVLICGCKKELDITSYSEW